jgi:flagellar assembly factor FliW
MVANMKIRTTRFGEIDVAEASLTNFPNGLIGFEDLHKFYILNKEGAGSFWWLQSIEKPDVAFLMADPQSFVPDYSPELAKEDIQALQVSDPNKVEFGVILTIPEDPRETTANLLAPIAINLSNRTAAQIIMRDNRYSTRQMIAQSAIAGGER